MLNRIQLISFVAVGVIVALTAASTSATATDLAPQHLGPVGHDDPILTTVGSLRVIAFFLTEIDHCGLNTVVWDPKYLDTGNPDTGMTAEGSRVSLDEGQVFHIDSGAELILVAQHLAPDARAAFCKFGVGLRPGRVATLPVRKPLLADSKAQIVRRFPKLSRGPRLPQ